jgi:hypothetical protein
LPLLVLAWLEAIVMVLPPPHEVVGVGVMPCMGATVDVAASICVGVGVGPEPEGAGPDEEACFEGGEERFFGVEVEETVGLAGRCRLLPMVGVVPVGIGERTDPGAAF